MQELVSVVPVRAGSKGLPGKNTRLLAGMPLYMHAVTQGIRTIGKVLLSTDIDAIKAADLPPNCELVRRPQALASDAAEMADVLSHLIASQGLIESVVVLLQATSPLRSDADVCAAIDLYRSGRHELVMTVTERDSRVLKFGTCDDGDFQPIRDPRLCFANRQALPRVYGPNGAVYVFAARDFVERGGFPCQSIGALEMPADRSVSIDDEQDFVLAERILISRMEQS